MNNISLKSSVQLQNDDTKKHNTAITSKESFAILNTSGQRQCEKGKILETIQNNQPVTSRMLSDITKIERTNITRCLFDLVNDEHKKIKIAYIDKCPKTKRRVKYYALVDWPQIPLFKSL